MYASENQSEKFCAADGDVVFRSCDGMLFNIHRKNLETNTGGFPPSEFSTMEEIVPLSETSATLELLFQFIYPQRHPDLESIGFNILAPLAEAAEKYEVFSAMTICRIRMRDFLPQHVPELLGYAAKHDYPEIIAAAASLAIASPLIDIVTALPGDLIIPWVRYHEEWCKVLRSASSCSSHIDDRRARAPNEKSGCTWVYISTSICSKFGGKVESLLQLDYVFPSVRSWGHSCCALAVLAWRKRVEQEIAQIPEFSTFL